MIVSSKITSIGLILPLPSLGGIKYFKLSSPKVYIIMSHWVVNLRKLYIFCLFLGGVLLFKLRRGNAIYIV